MVKYICGRAGVKANLVTLISLWMLLPADAAQSEYSKDPAENSLSVTAAYEYDSNVARSSQALAAFRGLSRQDQIYTPSAQLNYSKSFGRGELFVSGTAGYELYQVNSRLNSDFVDVQGGIRQEIGGCKTTVLESYARQRSGLDDLTTLVTQNLETTNSISVKATCFEGEPISTDFWVSPSWITNSAPVLITSNSRSVVAHAAVSYSRSNLTGVSLVGEFSTTDFPDRYAPLTSKTAIDGYQFYGGGLQLTYAAGERLKTSISVLQTSVVPSTPSTPSFSGINYELNVSYSLTPRVRLEASATKGIAPSDRLDTAYSVDQTFRAALSYMLDPHIDFMVDGRVAREHFLGGGIAQGVDLTRQIESSIDMTMRVEIWRRCSINIIATEERRNADPAGYSYSDARVGLALSVAI